MEANTILLGLFLLVVVVLAFVLGYRQRTRAQIETPLGKLTVDGENPSPPQPEATTVAGDSIQTTVAGGSQVAVGKDVQQVKVGRDLTRSKLK